MTPLPCSATSTGGAFVGIARSSVTAFLDGGIPWSEVGLNAQGNPERSRPVTQTVIEKTPL